TVEPFAGAIREGRIYGRGACDTKGPMAAAVSALGRWVQSPGWAESETEWVFAATIGEEDRGAGALALCRDGLRADFAIALEPTDLRVIHGLKGKLRVGITVRGRACHAAHAEEGINAIYRAVPVLRVCERLAAEWTVRRHPLLGSAVLNLGLISGGTGLNIVPDRCEMGLDIRTHPDFTHTDAIRELEREVGREAPGAECIVLMAGPPMLTESRNPLVRDLAALGAGLGVESWFSDANTFSAAGIPSVAFGPGSISQAHTADEWISIDELNQGAEILFRFMSGRG
ncbi:MAG: M20/M25/M40 family metallo-hydrolase, partial [Kiritimatiellia bacterium]|nr:M20/M25/M40 family metallo-hydrolase [Kiritimatiellia bacterium]